MKRIKKQSEPKEFVDWKANWPPDSPPTFNALRGTKTGHLIKKALIQEQGGLCCYCECRVTENDSHFEHFRPQSRFKELSLNYDNLLCSCINEPKRISDLHCGHFKGEWFEETNLISPLDPSCEQRFKYDSKGNIEPADKNDTAAEKTKDKLGLNNGDFPERRRQVIDIFNGAGREPLTETDIDNFTIEDQRKTAEGYLLPDRDGSFSEFWTTMQYCLHQLPPSRKN